MSEQFFLSYSHKDQPHMEQVCDSFRTRGIEIWTDQKLPPGIDWMKGIKDSIDESQALIVLATPNASKSRWVSIEVKYAFQKNKPIYILLRDGTEDSAIPEKLILGTLQYVDIRDTKYPLGIDKLVKTLAETFDLDVKTSKHINKYEDVANTLLGSFIHRVGGNLGGARSLIQDMIEDYQLSDPELLEDIHFIINIIDNLLEETREMGTISRVMRGILPDPELPVNLSISIREVVNNHNKLVKDKIIDTSYSKEQLLVNIEAEIAKRVFDELISNALHYTNAGDTITIITTKDQNHAIFSIKDTGIGIPVDKQDEIFEIGTRAENARIKRSSGTGLGLYLVKNIVEYYGGTITFISDENTGSEFKVMFPLA